jgi:hypothetical protein
VVEASATKGAAGEGQVEENHRQARQLPEGHGLAPGQGMIPMSEQIRRGFQQGLERDAGPYILRHEQNRIEFAVQQTRLGPFVVAFDEAEAHLRVAPHEGADDVRHEGRCDGRVVADGEAAREGHAEIGALQKERVVLLDQATDLVHQGRAGRRRFDALGRKPLHQFQLELLLGALNSAGDRR